MFTSETLSDFLASGLVTRHALSKAPRCELVIDAVRKELRLETPATESVPDVAAYDRIRFDVVDRIGDDAAALFQLAVDVDGAAYEGYSLLMSVVDQLEDGATFRSAVDIALATYRDLLSRARGLSDEQQTGLFGELGVLLHLMDSVGEEPALRAWLGPENEEHDFVLEDVDLEVKTTLGERRVHVIGSASQLSATGERPLYLVSLQVTKAGDAAGGETLPERVARVRQRLGRATHLIEEHLRRLGWDDDRALSLYRRRYLQRTQPRAYLVDEDFPAIDHHDIASVVSQPELVLAVSYRIDLTSLPWTQAPAVLDEFCEGASRDRA
ncbi:PD-(D/E)XK motif protein [Demequina rhizosphaerae]|uniref:PD-(D/E)XK motif protein n=1 Tax=Demequina rhizosphaerae TaxID=1638985 RepID=UPI0007848666|nr:PD-(D/E)XK motif protein [Demequina rhizosphaerae]